MDRALSELECSILAQEWPKWKQSFLMYMLASGKDADPEPKKIATFLWLAGSKATGIYNALFPNDGTTSSMLGTAATSADPVSSKDVGRSLDDVLKAFDKHSIPFRNTTMETFKFNNIIQADGQLFIEFETQLRKQMQLCDFECTCGQKYEERMLMDRIIIGINDKRLQLKLLDSKNKKLEDVLNECKAYEAATENNAILQNQQRVLLESSTINAVARKCYNCGATFNRNHLVECRAKEATCHACGKRGHFARYCEQQKKRDKQHPSGSSISNIFWLESAFKKVNFEK
nr:uncharacterized protein LOC122321861 [Drosophila bipectinata]